MSGSVLPRSGPVLPRPAPSGPVLPPSGPVLPRPVRGSRRLGRGGDRRADGAPPRIVFTRLCHDPRTREYHERRTQEGRTRRESIRCLRPHAAREVSDPVGTVSSVPSSQGRPRKMRGSDG
ncbi:hypothetical protein GCM10010406_25170 [Streptomyces thermolineatus]|uniref:Uncharacterized protein n=1 Tax=Streptomyces thermolineatus TaxID=44033 RepID=A0ABP5YXV7_9ACTN